MSTPGIRQLGPVLQIEGPALESLAALVSWAVSKQQAAAVRTPPHGRAIADAALAAWSEQQGRQHDTAADDSGQQWISAQEVADRLGIHTRTVQRRADDLGATRTASGRLRYPLNAPQRYRLLTEESWPRSTSA